MWSAGDGGPSTVAVWYCSKHFPFKPKPYNINEDVEIWRVRYEEAQAMHDEMANKVRDLMQERDAALADAERIDWLEKHPRLAEITVNGKTEDCFYYAVAGASGVRLRDIIDAARKESDK
jgi:hypothetical protein